MWLLAMMPALSALAYAPGVWGARVSVIGNTAVQTARGTAGQHLAAGHMLRNRFVLIECLGSASVGTQQGEQGERREAHNEGVNPVPGETFPSVGRLATYSNLYRSLTFKGPKHLGTGSFGDTWRAFDNDRKQFVVLKIFFERFFSERRYLKSDNQWQVQEAAEECLQIQQILATPGADTDPGAKHICQCYENHTTDADDVDQPPFLVLENCGESLEHYQQATFSKRWSWRKHVVEGILEAVDFLSRHNVIHHDLKPDNVCVTNAGEAKLIDFGGMQVWPQKHDPCVSTAGYAAPEFRGYCFDADAPSSAFDSYSTGRILLELLCGKGKVDISDPMEPCTGWLGGFADAGAVEAAAKLTKSNASQRASPAEALRLLQGQGP